MRKAIVLLELIISIILLSMVMLFSIQFFKQLHEVNRSEFEQQLHSLNLQSSKIFLEHLFSKSVHFNSTHNSITFFETAQQSFLDGSYSGIVNLEQSSKVKINTPYSHINQLKNIYAVYFNDTHWYETQPSNESEYIYFKNPNTKKEVYETYQLIEQNSSLYFKDKTLFYNTYTLLEDVDSFTSSLQNRLLTINICQNSQCEVWRFSL